MTKKSIAKLRHEVRNGSILNIKYYDVTCEIDNYGGDSDHCYGVGPTIYTKKNSKSFEVIEINDACTSCKTTCHDDCYHHVHHLDSGKISLETLDVLIQKGCINFEKDHKWLYVSHKFKDMVINYG